MQTKIKFSAFLLLTTMLIFTSCSDDDVKKGCTDISAVNFNNLAKEDDGSCVYLDSSFTIFSNNKLGFWGSPIVGGFSLGACFTNQSTIFLNPDTVIVPADTIIDNSVTPPDTTITPADTTINGETFLLVNSDVNGEYALIIKLLNKRSAAEFKNGFLRFEAKLHPDAFNVGFTNFGVAIHGNNLNLGANFCDEYRHSNLVQITTAVLDTNSFKEVIIPLIDFPNRQMQNIDLVFGVKGANAPANTNLLIINNVKWVTNLEN